MSPHTRTIAIRCALLIAWAGAIFFLSAQPSLELSPDPVINWVTRKMAHMFVYAVLAVLAFWTVRGLGVRRPMLVAVAIAAVYAASDEFHQSFVAGRSPLVTDVLIDIGGATLGLLLVRWFAARRSPGLPA